MACSEIYDIVSRVLQQRGPCDFTHVTAQVVDLHNI